MPSLHGRGRGDACYSVVVEVPRKLAGKQRGFSRSTSACPPARSRALVGGFLESLKKLFDG
jgi:hypothetical protein